MNAENTDSQFFAGFITAMLLIASCALILRVEKWFAANHGSRVKGLTTPIFSFVDLFSLIMFVLLVTTMIVLCKWAWVLKR